MGDLFKVKAFRPWGDIQRLLYRFEASPNKSDKPPVSIVHHLPQNSRRTPVQIYNKKYCGNIWFSQFRDHTSICPLLLTIAIIPNSCLKDCLKSWLLCKTQWPQMASNDQNRGQPSYSCIPTTHAFHLHKPWWRRGTAWMHWSVITAWAAEGREKWSHLPLDLQLHIISLLVKWRSLRMVT